MNKFMKFMKFIKVLTIIIWVIGFVINPLGTAIGTVVLWGISYIIMNTDIAVRKTKKEVKEVKETLVIDVQ